MHDMYPDYLIDIDFIVLVMSGWIKLIKILLMLFKYSPLHWVGGGAGVSGFFIDMKSFRLHYGPGVDSASNRNEYQEYFLGVKAAGA